MLHIKNIIALILAFLIIAILSSTSVLMLSTSKYVIFRNQNSSLVIDNIYRKKLEITRYDRDGDGISDLINLRDNTTYDLIVILRRINKKTLSILKHKGITISHIYHSALKAIHISSISIKGINLIKKVMGRDLVLIEPNFKRSILMDRATKLVGIRDYLWPFLEDINIPVTVAIVDTGIDTNHSDLINRVVYWEDLTEKYSHPVDFNGHGTMVSSIIAGSGYSSINDFLNITNYGELSSNPIEIFSLDVPFSQYVGFHLDIKKRIILNSTVKLIIQNEENHTNKELQFSTNGTKRIFLNGGYYRLYLSSDVPGWYRLIININKKIDDNPPMRGVNDKLRLAVFKIFKRSSGITYDSVVLEALDRIAELAKTLNIVAINLSLGGYAPSLSLDYAINELARKGIVTIVAAGNSYLALSSTGITERQIGSPATAAYAITVGGVNDYLGIAIYSSRGGSYTDGPNLPYVKPDVVAPSGGLIYGSWIISADTNSPDNSFMDIPNDYTGGIGTSFAAPLVTGVVASLISYLIQKNMWQYNLSSVLFLKSLLLSSAIETHFIGLHETIFNFNNTTIYREIPSFDYGKKDYDEGFGLIHIPSLVFALRNNFSDFKSIRIRVTPDNMSEFSIGNNVFSLAFLINLDGCYKIKSSLPSNYLLLIYKLYGWEGSPIFVKSIEKHEDEIDIRGKGTYLVAIKPITGGKINMTISIEIQKTMCISFLVIMYVLALSSIGALVIVSTYLSRKKKSI